MHIYSVSDPEFKSYGNVWDNVPSELTSPVLEALASTPIPEGSKYVASAPELEGVKDADKLGFLMFGGRPFQLGWCNGHNTRLNCLEYHRASEFNLGARDFILLVAHRWEIEDGKLDTACVKAFRVPAGTLVEVFNTTLHYTPCMVDDGGFQVMVALPAGTNGPRPEAAADLPLVTATATGGPTSGFSAMLTAPRLPRAATWASSARTSTSPWTRTFRLDL